MTDSKKSIDDKERVINSTDSDDKPVKVIVIQPTAQHYRDSQVEYNKAFRSALDSGALLRQKLTDYMEQQGIWNEEKQKQHDKFVDDINKKETLLKGGGIRLSEAKDVALELRNLREDFRDFLAERNALDSNSAEGQADNARFVELVRLCILNPDTKQPCFPDQAAYDANADQPWVSEASAELANMIYGLDPNYDNNLEENKFLKEFSFVNEDLKFINNDGHLVDADGRLVNEDGRFVAYRTKEAIKSQDPEQVYFVNRDGEEVVSVTNDEGEEEWVQLSLKERKPFLDDDGKPVIVESSEEEAPEEKEDAPKAADKPQKRAKRNTKDAKSTQ